MNKFLGAVIVSNTMRSRAQYGRRPCVFLCVLLSHPVAAIAAVARAATTAVTSEMAFMLVFAILVSKLRLRASLSGEACDLFELP